jgi:hypothetical protein
MMRSKLVTGTKEPIFNGVTLHTLKFECEMESADFRDDIVNMIVAALGGAKVEGPEQKPRALGFQKEDEDE